MLDVQKWETKSELLLELGRALESRHSRGLRTVLIVDEARNLFPHVLEEIRLLSNFESNTAKQLQIVLTGQPELGDVLNNPDLRQLKQRIALALRHQAAAERRRDRSLHHFAFAGGGSGTHRHFFT